LKYIFTFFVKFQRFDFNFYKNKNRLLVSPTIFLPRVLYVFGPYKKFKFEVLVSIKKKIVIETKQQKE